MAADGEERRSKRISDILERKNRNKAVADSLVAPNVVAVKHPDETEEYPVVI